MAEDLKKMYRTIMDDHFPPKMEISFVDQDKRQTLFYEKVSLFSRASIWLQISSCYSLESTLEKPT